jgi:uncharacterized RDD family membrane protein YckC
MRDDLNPFEPPQADPEVDSSRAFSGSLELAGRGTRLAAAFLDGLIMIAIIVPIQLVAGVYENFPQVRQDPVETVLWSLGGFVLWLGVNGYPLAKHSQSIGKRIFGIRIVNFDDDERASFSKIVLRRVLPVQIVGSIPVLGSVIVLIDAVLIFQKDRRCIHDHIARTRVVVVNPSRR